MKTAQKDLEFLAGRFLDMEIPKEKRYLAAYFATEIQAMFLRYYLIFGNWKGFIDHTGRYLSVRTLKLFEKRFHRVVEHYESAKKSLTEEGMEKLALMERGEFPLAKMGIKT